MCNSCYLLPGYMKCQNEYNIFFVGLQYVPKAVIPNWKQPIIIGYLDEDKK